MRASHPPQVFQQSHLGPVEFQLLPLARMAAGCRCEVREHGEGQPSRPCTGQMHYATYPWGATMHPLLPSVALTLTGPCRKLACSHLSHPS